MHPCPVGECDEPVPDDKLMCRGHWFMVPEPLRRDVWRAYHQLQAHRGDINRARDLRAAQAAAVAAVEAKVSKLA